MADSKTQEIRSNRLPALRLHGIPVFNYHGLASSLTQDVSETRKRYVLSSQKFRSHLAHIHDFSIQVNALDDLKESVSTSLPNSLATAVTFDDGLGSDYEIAFPLLAEFGMRGVFFLNTTTIGQTGYLDWPRIAEMQRHGMSIQSHGLRHVDLTVLPTHSLNEELAESKHCLEDRLGVQVEFLAAPHGILNRRVVAQALAVGFRAVCSTRCWPARPGSKVLTRITVLSDISIEEFHGYLTGSFWPYAVRLSHGLLHRPFAIADHLRGTLRHRVLKQPVPESK